MLCVLQGRFVPFSLFADSFGQYHVFNLHQSGLVAALVFAVVNLINGEWDPAAASFGNDNDFLAFVRRAKAQALYDTGVEVSADDQIITLITCDRSYHDKDGRLLVMAVAQ